MGCVKVHNITLLKFTSHTVLTGNYFLISLFFIVSRNHYFEQGGSQKRSKSLFGSFSHVLDDLEILSLIVTTVVFRFCSFLLRLSWNALRRLSIKSLIFPSTCGFNY
jgi:hypothetical protein